jgi:hypothetical protein
MLFWLEQEGLAQALGVQSWQGQTSACQFCGTFPLSRPPLVVSYHSKHAAEPDMAGCRVVRLRIASRRTVEPAVVRRAQVRAALNHLARDAWPGLSGIVALHLGGAVRIARCAAWPAEIARVTGGIPVFGPLPDIAGHIEQIITVGGAPRPARVPETRPTLRSAMEIRLARYWPSNARRV